MGGLKGESLAQATELHSGIIMTATQNDFILVVHLVYEGKVPKEVQQMLAFEQIGWKKTYVILGNLGRYVGVGRDGHVENFFMLFIPTEVLERARERARAKNKSPSKIREDPEIQSWMNAFSNYLQMNPGMHTNDVVAGEQKMLPEISFLGKTSANQPRLFRQECAKYLTEEQRAKSILLPAF